MPGVSAIPVAVCTVLAHQGGWDEMVMVAAPIAAFAGLLWAANRRADAGEEEDAGAQEAHVVRGEDGNQHPAGPAEGATAEDPVAPGKDRTPPTDEHQQPGA